MLSARRRRRIALAALVLGSWCVPVAWAINLPEGFVDEAVISQIPGQITGFEIVPGEASPTRVYLSEKSGVVRVAVDGQILPTPFLDISAIVNDRVDRGLMDLALHPQFPATPYVYVIYTYDPPELVTNGYTGPGRQDGNGNRVARLVRYTADPAHDHNVALAGSEVVLMGRNSTFENIGEPEGRYDTSIPSCGPIGDPLQDCLPIDELSHTLGSVAFAPDGTLYVTNGDGASYQSIESLSFMALDIDSMRGKIFRIDPETGGGVPANPHFDGNPQSNRSKVIAHGLRNPYSLAIHPETGEPFVGDVGFENFEEINGGFNRNFGWPCFLGSNAAGQNVRSPGFEDLELCQAYFDSGASPTPPMISWPWVNGAAAIVGDFYTGTDFPAEYQGKLFYGDFVQGFLRYADVDDGQQVQATDFATEVAPMTQITTGADGALYYASITTNELRRIRYTGANGGASTGAADGGVTDGSTGGGQDTTGGGSATAGGTDGASTDSMNTDGASTDSMNTDGASTTGSGTDGTNTDGADAGGTGEGSTAGAGDADGQPVRIDSGGAFGALMLWWLTLCAALRRAVWLIAGHCRSTRSTAQAPARSGR